MNDHRIYAMRIAMVANRVERAEQRAGEAWAAGCKLAREIDGWKRLVVELTGEKYEALAVVDRLVEKLEDAEELLRLIREAVWGPNQTGNIVEGVKLLRHNHDRHERNWLAMAGELVEARRVVQAYEDITVSERCHDD